MVTSSSATVDGRRARGCLGSPRRSFVPSRLVFRVMRKIQRPASTIRQKCFYPLILRMSLEKRSQQIAIKIITLLVLIISIAIGLVIASMALSIRPFH